MALRIDKTVIPDKLRTFVELGLDFDQNRIHSNQHNSDCPLCGGRDKFFVNVESQLWDCKKCGERGNVYTFIQAWYSMWKDAQKEYKSEMKYLSENRKIPVEYLEQSGIIYDADAERYVIPIYSYQGKLNQLQFYDPDEKPRKKGDKPRIRNISGMTAQLGGMELLPERGRTQERVFIVEGHWDKVAMEYLLEEEGESGVVLNCPGVDVWKKEWTEHLLERDVICCYDKGVDGMRGVVRLNNQLSSVANTFRYLKWPEALPEGYDVRDAITTNDCTVSELMGMAERYVSPTDEDKKKEVQTKEILSKVGGVRPTWETVREIWQRNFHMNESLLDSLKCVLAVYLTVNIPKEPLWLNVIAPPGALKTVLLMSTALSSYCVARSTLTPNVLVSGFPRKEDPSLIPKLQGKVLVIKDGTEILGMPKDDKEKIYSTLRGAYDGSVHKEYGNGEVRNYSNVHFNMLFGVTPKIYAERSASLGERNLNLHMIKGVEFESDDAIMSALSNFGKDVEIPVEVTDAMTAFIDLSDIANPKLPDIDIQYHHRIRALAQLVAVLRANVERDFRSGKMLMRPQPEMATRLAVQLYKLFVGLTIVGSHSSQKSRRLSPTLQKQVEQKEINENLRIVTKVALDTCTGFNLEVLSSLVEKPEQNLLELSESCDMPLQTLRDQVEDLIQLGAVNLEKGESDSRGRKPNIYSCNDRLKKMWLECHIGLENGRIVAIERERRNDGQRLIKKRRA